MKHPELAAGRWWELSLAEQLGNVGSEVSRLVKWRNRDSKIADGALERLLELMDLTMADPRHRSSPPRLRELARTREVLVDYFFGDNIYRSSAEDLSKYFDAFAIAARRRMPPEQPDTGREVVTG